MAGMKSRAKGLYATESMVGIAERVMAQLQDAGVTHVRDVAIYYTPADWRGQVVEVGTAEGLVDELVISCGELALPMAVAKLEVRRPTPGRRAAPKFKSKPRSDRET